MVCLRFAYYCLVQLAGVVAVEVTGGPAIEFVVGRKVRLYLWSYTLLLQSANVIVHYTVADQQTMGLLPPESIR